MDWFKNIQPWNLVKPSCNQQLGLIRPIQKCALERNTIIMGLPSYEVSMTLDKQNPPLYSDVNYTAYSEAIKSYQDFSGLEEDNLERDYKLLKNPLLTKCFFSFIIFFVAPVSLTFLLLYVIL